MDRDPTKISAALVQLRGQIEALLCQGNDHLPNCSCKKIRELYGTNLYRCDRQFCQFYSTGFATRRERDVHLKVHSRPYRCPHTDCVFTELGFKSSPELARHCEQTHPPQRRNESRVVSAELVQHVSEKDIKALIEDAVRHDETDTVLYLLKFFNYSSNEYFDEYYALHLQRLAATYASGNMVRCILDQAQMVNKELDIEGLLLAAIHGENMLALQYLVIKTDEVMSRKDFGTLRWKPNSASVLSRAFSIGNADIMDILINDGRMELPSTCPADLFKYLIVSKRDDTEKVRRLRSMKKYVIWPEAFTNAVYWAALKGSIILVQGCLDCGGSANAVAKTRGSTALYQCVRMGSRRHAEVVKLLLQNGAYPNAKPGLTRLRGCAKIEKYFGMSWEDLVIQTQGHTS